MIKMSSIEKKELSFVNKFASDFKIQFKGCRKYYPKNFKFYYQQSLEISILLLHKDIKL
jgi:hypothetical protein